MLTSTNTIQKLNDEFRRQIVLGRQGAFITSGVAALGWEAVQRIIKTVAVFDDFNHRNDPYAEHDFGSFEAEGHTIFFKIDYYDRALAVIAGSHKSQRHRQDHHRDASGGILNYLYFLRSRI